MLNVNFNKNVFYNNEVAECFYTYDNSKSLLDTKEIEFELCQSVEIIAKVLFGSRTFRHDFEILENRNKAVIVAGWQAQVSDSMRLNLGNLKFPVNPTKKKKTGLLKSIKVNRSPEEIFQL